MTEELGSQKWDAETYAQLAAFVPQLGQNVFDMLAPKAGERILDLGCGAGDLTNKIVQAGARVTGIDASQSMVDHARSQGVDAHLCDARKLNYVAEFDAVFSNAVLHWIKDHKAVLDGVHRALRPGGRFVAEFGGFGNVAAITSSLIAVLESHGLPGRELNPWYNPSVAGYSAALKDAGFQVPKIELIGRPTPLPNGMETWLDMFAKAFFDGVEDGATKKSLKVQVLDALEPNLKDESGMWYADYVRLRFVAISE